MTETIRNGRNGKDNPWKWISGSLGSILLAMIIGWFTFVKDVPSKADVTRMIEMEAPYSKDRSGLTKQVEMNSQAVQRLQTQMSEISRRQVRIETKLDIIIKQLDDMKTK